jgi:hypothetical protein
VSVKLNNSGVFTIKSTDVVLTMLASGNVAVICEGPSASTVVKYNKKGDALVDGITSACSYEMDMYRVLWKTLAETGLSRHVCQPLGKYVHPTEQCVGIELEKLRGVVNSTTGRVNIEDLITGVSRGEVHVPNFGAVFRSLVLQTLYTLTMCTLAFKGRFRHNDLHARNVCLTPWTDTGASIPVHYVLPCFPSDVSQPFVNKHFSMQSTYRAVMVDFGWSTITGTNRDARFFRPVATTKSMAMRDLLATDPGYKHCGMSQRVPCHQYDVALFMYSVYSVCLLACVNLKCPPDATYELREFMHMFNTLYDGVPMVAGRLSLDLQKRLLRFRTTGGAKDTRVPTAESILHDDYFTQFRADAPIPSAHPYVFGLTPSPGVCIGATDSKWLVVGKEESSYLAGIGPWELRGERWGPATGFLSDLLTTLHTSVTDWKRVHTRDGCWSSTAIPHRAPWDGDGDAEEEGCLTPSHAHPAPVEYMCIETPQHAHPAKVTRIYIETPPMPPPSPVCGHERYCKI